ncbi:signal peptidase II [Hydrogenovibrio sp. JE_KL2]|uniref:signal peptidase II n=1 Tax=Hydrogenovibrio sp. JE_KL2 TaxID=2651188 RepID=UPI00128E2D5A|nr:signal peptidase II [Hydrogenovibrio sp. JE_KL2]MPQ76806.1 lipoprotein signal peptidase [Hydrogenovibrio sp. JE_KL2]
MNGWRSTGLVTLWLALLVIVLDQLTKYWANSALEFGVPVAVLPHLNFTLVYNEGAAFSFLADMGGWQRWLFSALAVAVSLVLIFWLKRLPSKWTLEVVGINLVLSGALGNVIDRLIEGRVTDFVDFYIGLWHYATFNVADIAISIGAVILLWSEFFSKKSKETE